MIAALALPAQPLATTGLLPAVVLPIGVFLSLWFNRGRAFLALVSMFLAYAGYALAAHPDASTFAERAVLAGIAIFVPLNVTLILILPERGVLHFRSYRWLLLLAAESLLVAWIASAGISSLSGTAWQSVLDHWLLRPSPTPLLARVLFAAAIALAIGRVLENRAPVEIGLGSALLAFFAGCTWRDSPAGFSVFVTAAGTILLIAVLQESHRMAFRDELTGLPGRRTLEEQLLGLGPVFTVAMVDVDHFKKFNDTHGHDVGDQVLRMVGARLAQVSGGGRAYRYGGEEFSVLFPDKTIGEVLPQLEALRSAIENHALVPRSEERRQSKREDADRRANVRLGSTSIRKAGHTNTRRADQRAGIEARSLSVTVSIGVAQRNRRLHTPAMVLRAADEALYRAKHAGRNRISR
ncbi:MAG: hypothetical protein AMJ66_07980 [Betaproteobacteria bacterium SG8_40]|nr:MAG: hypothetical protein AMJ66_07980 [Betaproteobacteria bacterium SG8_40]